VFQKIPSSFGAGAVVRKPVLGVNYPPSNARVNEEINIDIKL